MRKYTIVTFLMLSLIIGVSTGFADTNCYSNSIIQGWISERDTAARSILQQWAKGVPLEDMTSEVAVIFTNEIYTRSMCRNSIKFLNKHLIIPDKEYNLKMETLPALILKYFLGFDILIPSIQSKKSKKELKDDSQNL